MPHPLRTRQREAVQAAYAALRPLRRRADLGAAALAAYELLWFDAGGQPDRLAGWTLAALGAEFGRSPRAASKWLAALVDVGLVTVFDRTGGRLDLYVNHPDRIGDPRRVAPSPQRLLPGVDADDERDDMEPAAIIAHPALFAGPPAAHSGGSDVSARKGPTSDVSAHKGPRSPPDQNAQVKQAQAVDSRSPPPTSDVSAHKGPSAPHGSMDPLKEKILTRNKIHGTAWSMDYEANAVPSDAVPSDSARPIGAALVGAINGLCDRTSARSQKEQLVEHVLAIVHDPKMDASIAGRAADAVLVHHLPEAKLEALLEQIRCIWARRGREGFRTSPGALFHFAMRKLCREAGIRWPMPRKRQGE